MKYELFASIVLATFTAFLCKLLVAEARKCSWTLLEAILTVAVMGNIVAAVVAMMILHPDRNVDQLRWILLACGCGICLLGYVSKMTLDVLRYMHELKINDQKLRLLNLLRSFLILPSSACSGLAVISWLWFDKVQLAFCLAFAWILGHNFIVRPIRELRTRAQQKSQCVAQSPET